jgi:hypothetical protein
LLHSESLVLSQQMKVLAAGTQQGETEGVEAERRLDAVAVWAEEVLAVEEVARLRCAKDLK